MTQDIATFFSSGCGRCPLGGTPQCKVHTWTKELHLLRSILSSTNLTEELKWGSPCYTFEGKNVLMMSALKDAAVVGFFKGALLTDSAKLLVAPGPNSQAVRQFRFTDVDTIQQQEAYIRSYVAEAITLEKEGRQVAFQKQPEALPIELEEALSANPEFQAAFQALTPGKQRGYILHISGAKQSETRAARVEKCKPKILAGKGFQDR